MLKKIVLVWTCHLDFSIAGLMDCKKIRLQHNVILVVHDIAGFNNVDEASTSSLMC